MLSRFTVLLISLCLFTVKQAYAVKLDISSDTDIKAFSYAGLPYAGKEYNQSFISENTKIGLNVYGMAVENLPDTTLDIGITLQSIAGLSSSNTLTAPQFYEVINRLPDNGKPYIREAYVHVNSLIIPKFSATFGRQNFAVGQGLALGTDNMGFTGARLTFSDLFWGYGAEIFYFKPQYNDYSYNIYGGVINNKTNDGSWQMYHFFQHNGSGFSNGNFSSDVISETKTFTGIRYAMKKKHISFDGEAAVQGGSVDLSSGSTGNYSGYAFMLKGSWEQGIYIFDNARLRLAYGRSSADSSAGTKDRAFYADCGSRYDGFAKSGYGALAAVSVYDMLKTSATVNGLPSGFSGLSVASLGLDIPYKSFQFSADYFKYKASSAAKSRVVIGDEADISAVLFIGKALEMKALYAIFSPDSKVYSGVNKASLAFFSVKAKF